MTFLAKFVGGILDGAELVLPDEAIKVMVQLASGRILRYEADQIDESEEATIYRMVMTDLPIDYDVELFQDERDWSNKNKV